jgi:hypothetical protein
MFEYNSVHSSTDQYNWWGLSCNLKTTVLVAQYAMMSILVLTLLLEAAVTASVPLAVAGQARDSDGFVNRSCAHTALRLANFPAAAYFSTGRQSGATVTLQLRSKPCHDAHQGFREIQAESLACDVMACATCAAGPAPDVQHQPAGDVYQQFPIRQTYTMLKH